MHIFFIPYVCWTEICLYYVFWVSLGQDHLFQHSKHKRTAGRGWPLPPPPTLPHTLSPLLFGKGGLPPGNLQNSNPCPPHPRQGGGQPYGLNPLKAQHSPPIQTPSGYPLGFDTLDRPSLYEWKIPKRDNNKKWLLKTIQKNAVMEREKNLQKLHIG